MWVLFLCLALVLVSNKASCQSFPNRPQKINGQILELLKSGSTGQIPQNILHNGQISGISNTNNGGRQQGNKVSYSIEKNPLTGKLDLVITEKSLIPAENNNQRTGDLQQFFLPERSPQSQRQPESALNSATPDFLLNIIDPATGKVIGNIQNQNSIENKGTNTGQGAGIGGNNSNNETLSRTNSNGNVTTGRDIAIQTQTFVSGQEIIGSPSAAQISIVMDQQPTDMIKTEKTKGKDRTNNIIQWSVFGDSTRTSNQGRISDNVKSPVRVISPGSPSFSEYSALTKLGSTVMETVSRLPNNNNLGSDPIYLSNWKDFHNSMPTPRVNVGIGANPFSSQGIIMPNARDPNAKGTDINGRTIIQNVKIISPGQQANSFNLLKSLPRLDQIDQPGNGNLDIETVFRAQFTNQNRPNLLNSQRQRGRNRSQENNWNRRSTSSTLLSNQPRQSPIMKKSMDVLKNPVLQEILKKFSLKPTKIVFLSPGVQSSNIARKLGSLATTRNYNSRRQTPTRNQNKRRMRYSNDTPGLKPTKSRKGGY